MRICSLIRVVILSAIGLALSCLRISHLFARRALRLGSLVLEREKQTLKYRLKHDVLQMGGNWHSRQAKNAAIRPEMTIPSNVPAPPIERMPVCNCSKRRRFSKSAPISGPATPATKATGARNSLGSLPSMSQAMPTAKSGGTNAGMAMPMPRMGRRAKSRRRHSPARPQACPTALAAIPKRG
jgi:hypothetical protein